MVGTPQLPLKYRRKGISDYCVYPPDQAMQYPSASAFDSYKFGSDCSMPRSPTIFSSSSSNAPSSPVRSLHTPEPFSSPLPEPYIASSPKSPRPMRRKGFWEVAFNYGPDFPYKGHPPVQTPDYTSEQLITRRRSSSSSAPALVPDVEPSDYSEDNDLFHMDDDAASEEDAPGSVTIVNSRDEQAVGGSRGSDLLRDTVVDTANNRKSWPGEMDVAAVLLDLSRQVRFGSVESRAEDIAVKPCPNPVQQGHLTPIPGQSSQMVQETTVASESTAHSVPRDGIQNIEPYRLDEHGMHGQNSILEETTIRSEMSSPVIDVNVSTDTADNQLCSTADPVDSDNIDLVSDDVAMSNVGGNLATNDQDSINTNHATQCPTIIDEQRQDENSIAQSIFSSVLTPISSPALTGSELTEPLSNLSSPEMSVLELTGPSSDTRQSKARAKESNDRAHSPVAGPSNRQIGSVDQRDARTKHKSGQLRRKLKKDRHRGELDKNVGEANCEQLEGTGKKKRARSNSTTESRLALSSPSTSNSDAPRPRKKRSKKSEEGDTMARSDGTSLQASPSSRTVSTSTLPPHGSSTLHDPQSDTPLPAPSEDSDADVESEMCGCLIQAMALSRASSMPASSLLREVLRENPHLANQRSRSDWLGVVSLILESHDVFGRVERKGFDADDKPLEAQWFYIPENDPDQERASLLRDMMPKKRNETKKYKQYFFKPLDKFSRWDPEYAP